MKARLKIRSIRQDKKMKKNHFKKLLKIIFFQKTLIKQKIIKMIKIIIYKKNSWKK